MQEMNVEGLEILKKRKIENTLELIKEQKIVISRCVEIVSRLFDKIAGNNNCNKNES